MTNKKWKKLNDYCDYKIVKTEVKNGILYQDIRIKLKQTIDFIKIQINLKDNKNQ